MGLFNDDMTGLAAAYASMNDGKYLLTNADKVGNTPAWQNRYKVNESTGEMLYEMADHLKEAYEEELIARIDATLEELRRLDEGKIPAGLQAYLDKKKGKKGNGDKKEEENGNGKDHGNGNGLAHARSHAVRMQKSGRKFRQIYGVEFYFVPSLQQWKEDYAAHKQAIQDAKTAAAAEKKSKEKIDIDADDESGGLVVEDEDEGDSTYAPTGLVTIDTTLLERVNDTPDESESIGTIYTKVLADFGTPTAGTGGGIDGDGQPDDPDIDQPDPLDEESDVQGAGGGSGFGGAGGGGVGQGNDGVDDDY